MSPRCCHAGGGEAACLWNERARRLHRSARAFPPHCCSRYEQHTESQTARGVATGGSGRLWCGRAVGSTIASSLHTTSYAHTLRPSPIILHSTPYTLRLPATAMRGCLPADFNSAAIVIDVHSTWPRGWGGATGADTISWMASAPSVRCCSGKLFFDRQLTHTR